MDFLGIVGDDFLEELGLVKGIWKVVGYEERGKVLCVFDGCYYKFFVGGFFFNILVVLVRLGFGSS